MKAKHLVGMIWGIISGFHGFELYLTAVPVFTAGHQIISKAACVSLGPTGGMLPQSPLSPGNVCHCLLRSARETVLVTRLLRRLMR